MRTNLDKNLHNVFISSTAQEKREGLEYYSQQYRNLWSFAVASKIPMRDIIVAFCALSPNNTEQTTYLALASCIAITLGNIPETAPVSAYGRDKEKALKILRENHRLDPQRILKGRKTYSFYRNTLDPSDLDYVTIDGHMYNAFNCGTTGQKPEPLDSIRMSLADYSKIQYHVTKLAHENDIYPAQCQAIIWLTWKRLNNIVYSAQLPLESGVSLSQAQQMIDQSPEFQTSYQNEDGKFLNTDISDTIPVQISMEFEKES